MTPNDILPCSQISALLLAPPSSEQLPPQQTNAEIRSQTVEHSVLNGMSPLSPSPQGSMNLVKEAERFLRAGGMEDIKETRPF